MKMKSLQELVLFFHEKWKIKVKKFHKREDKKLLIKKRYKEFSDFPFEKIPPFEILSWLDYSSQGWIILSSDLTIKYINDKALKLIRRIKYKDVIGKAINDISELEIVRDKILYSRKKDLPCYLDFNIFGDPINAKIVKGRKKTFLIVLESKLSIEALKDRQTQLINDVSHELKTPLTSLILIGERLESTVSKKDKYLIKRLKKESKRLKKMVEETLELSKLNNSFSYSTNQKIVIEKLIIETCETLKPLAEKKEVNINIKCLDKYLISGDYQNLKRAYINIIDNAIRYSTNKEEIKIEIFRRDSSVVIKIRDNGVGIEDGDFNKVFGRFYRGDPSRSKFKKSGSGLGLSITKTIITNNKGFIKAYNNKDGGATIETIFPLVK